VENELIVVCGADFMGETTKIINPEKKVLIPAPAKCPMAEMLSKEELLKAQQAHPDAQTVLYVNSSTEARALADCCCTSANADKVVNAMESDTVLFGPDENLAHFVRKRSGKKIVSVPEKGFCHVHKKFHPIHLMIALEEHPEAEVLIHPECDPEIQERAHGVLSTSGMIRHAKASKAREFIIGTEVGLIHRLKKENPGKEFYPLNKDAVCLNQKEIGLKELYHCLSEEENEVVLPKEDLAKAFKAMQRMLEIK
jgi:quinolinate synthase